MSRMTIAVPASTANIGPGFDSAGMAVNRYLTLHVEESTQWEIEHRSVHLPSVPPVTDHLVYQAALHTANAYNKTLTPCKITMESEIPLARGLGSSASAIIAGIEVANQLCSLSLTKADKLKLATEMEGHPDNVAAALYGGFIVSVLLPNGEIEILQKADVPLDLVVYIPTFELKTEDARKVLPEQFSRNEAAAASAVSNVMIAALTTGDFTLAGKMMEADLFHEPYRATLIPNYEQIRQEAKLAGAYGTVISGAGPTMISFAPKGKGHKIESKLKTTFPSYEVQLLSMDDVGIHVSYISETEKTSK
nr:homoserine kinase [Paenibacillus bovis]